MAISSGSCRWRRAPKRIGEPLRLVPHPADISLSGSVGACASLRTARPRQAPTGFMHCHATFPLPPGLHASLAARFASRPWLRGPLHVVSRRLGPCMQIPARACMCTSSVRTPLQLQAGLVQNCMVCLVGTRVAGGRQADTEAASMADIMHIIGAQDVTDDVQQAAWGPGGRHWLRS